MALLTLPTELLVIIGQYVDSIYSLTLTCKTLHHTLYPLLFSKIELNCPEHCQINFCTGIKESSSGNLYSGLRALAALNKEDKYHRVHKLVIKSGTEFLPSLLTDTTAWYENRKAVNSLVCNALSGCGNLRELEYRLVETKVQTIDVMKTLPSLQCLKLYFQEGRHDEWQESILPAAGRSDSYVNGLEMEDNEERENDRHFHSFRARPVSVRGFKNLSTLHLGHISHCLSPYTRDIAQVMLESPGLADLYLESRTAERLFSTGHVCEDPHHDEHDHEIHRDFWQRLCEQYCKISSGYRIKLVALHLGPGVILNYFRRLDSAPKAASKDNYMAEAFDLSTLKRFATFNWSGQHRSIMAHSVDARINWKLLETATDLMELSIFGIRAGMLVFLESPGRRNLSLLKIHRGSPDLLKRYPLEWRRYEMLTTLDAMAETKIEFRGASEIEDVFTLVH